MFYGVGSAQLADIHVAVLFVQQVVNLVLVVWIQAMSLVVSPPSSYVDLLFEVVLTRPQEGASPTWEASVRTPTMILVVVWSIEFLLVRIVSLGCNDAVEKMKN